MGETLRPKIKELLFNGTVIPAYPLALHEDRSFDEFSQRVLTHYYIDAGVGGLAVGVHTTQFEIRDPEFDLYEKILRIASEEIKKAKLDHPFIKIAGICGSTDQAKNEAELAIKYGYDLGLLSMGNLPDYSEEDLLERTRQVAQMIPVFGFYLQPSVGGRVFSYQFWKEFMEIENVVAVKTAPFNRYQTLDVIRAVCSSTRKNEIVVYTGNDDNIVSDLLTTYRMSVDGKEVEKSIKGGLLGHWAVWTKTVVSIFNRIKKENKAGEEYAELLTLGTQITDVNAAFFDVKNNFKGSIPGINEVLARQGLLEGNYCLNPEEVMGEGQAEEITRVYENYPELSDDAFVKENLSKWTRRVQNE